MSQLDIYGKAVCYDGMYQIAKEKRGVESCNREYGYIQSSL